MWDRLKGEPSLCQPTGTLCPDSDVGVVKQAGGIQPACGAGVAIGWPLGTRAKECAPGWMTRWPSTER